MSIAINRQIIETTIYIWFFFRILSVHPFIHSFSKQLIVFAFKRVNNIIPSQRSLIIVFDSIAFFYFKCIWSATICLFFSFILATCIHIWIFICVYTIGTWNDQFGLCTYKMRHTHSPECLNNRIETKFLFRSLVIATAAANSIYSVRNDWEWEKEASELKWDREKPKARIQNLPSEINTYIAFVVVIF